jgi:predicted amino acid racemase
MAKQFGRNPDACKTLVEAGVPSAVAVDIQGMEAHVRSGTPVGHVGHLVQPHRGAEDAVIAAEPEVVTVFALEIARRIGVAAERIGREQDVLLRVTAPGLPYYFGHGGGFELDTIEESAERVATVPGLRVAGLAGWPCLLTNRETKKVEPTENFAVLAAAAERLRNAGFDIWQVNAPGTTSALTMPQLRRGGATHVEPGNAFHGTTPLHLFDSEAPEIPAIVYVTEVSHVEGNDAYAFAAGIYIDKLLGEYQVRAACGRDEGALRRIFPVDIAPDGAIHYYSILRLRTGHDVRVGDTVVYCFRPQTFVTRARTQAVVGVHSGSPEPLGVYDQEARLVDGVS